MQTYTVGYGDSVSKISKILYGDFSKTQEICKMNKLVDCNVVHPGQVLKVPDPTNVKDAEVIPLNADASGGWKKNVGKWFPWVVVGVAAYLITKEAHKQNKKKKATKSKPLGSRGLSGKKFGARKTKKKFHGRKAVTIGDWKVRYNSFYKKYQATHAGGNMEEFNTIDEAKKYIKRHG